MKIRKYVARSMPEALQQVRDDLGDHAVILNTRQVRRNNRFGPQEEPRVEVTAAFDETAPTGGGTAVPPPAEPAGARAAPWAARQYAPIPSARAGSGGVAPAAPPAAPAPAVPDPDGTPPALPAALRRPSSPAPLAPAPTGGVELQQLARGLRHLNEAVARLERRRGGGVDLPEALARLDERLRSLGLAADLADQTVQALLLELDGTALSDRDVVAERAAALLAAQLPECRDLRLTTRRQVVGFFGAAGAGKTTAAAKIAAGFALKRGGRVLLVSADDRRVGALDQARAYARIIGVPLETAYDGAEIAEVLTRYPQVRLVLVDLAGCGPRDQRERERQVQVLTAAGVEEVQVVLDGGSSLEHMLDQIEAATVFPTRRLLFTKMDDTLRPGPAVSAAIRSQVPTSYLGVGNGVPGQIEAGDLAAWVARAIGAPAADTKER